MARVQRAKTDVAAVVFAISSAPALSEIEALELAELLDRRRSLAAFSAAKKIREQARRDPGYETSEDVELDNHELREVAAVLAERREPEELPAFEHPRDEVTLAVGG